MAKTKLQSMGDFFSSMDRETVTTKDFEEKMQRVLALIKTFIQKTEERAARAEAKADQALRAVAEQHNLSLSDIKKQTNELFVSGRLDEMDTGQRNRFNELQGLLDTKLATLKPGAQGRPPTREEILSVVHPLIPKVDLTALKESDKTLREEMDKLKKAISIAARSTPSQVLAGPNANAVLSHDASDQCDGANKTFNMPMARRVNAVRCTQFPFFYRPTIDFTVGDRNIVLTSEVAAPESGQSFFIDYVK